MKVILTCAGTGGHINPAIAIANTIIEQETQSEILFIGTKDGLENDLVKKAGYDILHIRAGKLHRKITIKNIKNIANALLGIIDAKKIIKQFEPDIVIGTGGYITLSVMKAAKILNIPYIIHESNAFPGISIKLTAKDAKAVFLGFEAAKKRLHSGSNLVVTGTPAKFDITDMDKLDKQTIKDELDYSNYLKDKKLIFVTGGSQGARYFNEIVINMIDRYKPKNFFVVIATGMSNYEEVNSKIEEYNIGKYIKAERFIYDMAKMYKVSDLLITRTGAMTITEISIAAKPAILIPLKTAAENHQYFNAKVLEDRGAAKIILEDDLTASKLYTEINKLIENSEILTDMSKKARELYIPNVNKSIYKNIKEIVGY